MPTLTITLTADQLKAYCRASAQPSLDRACELEDGSTQDELLDGVAERIYAAFLGEAGLGWK